eukprot:TRINITY_DN15525_c0_g1_i1.p1 TRINITY_DN15525_c0_g1~~TRINITY_DN15525_c0_g1_i1.p1  ORF type:complete len:231 (-),score=32.11 TRINITY_DN15525_c0_g1_i1:133-792(-)
MGIASREEIRQSVLAAFVVTALAAGQVSARDASWFLSTTWFNSTGGSCDGFPTSTQWEPSPTGCQLENPVLNTYAYTACSDDGSTVVYHSGCGKHCDLCLFAEKDPSGMCTPSQTSTTSCVAKQPPAPANSTVLTLNYFSPNCTGTPASGSTLTLNKCFVQVGYSGYNIIRYSPGDAKAVWYGCQDYDCSDNCSVSATISFGCFAYSANNSARTSITMG